MAIMSTKGIPVKAACDLLYRMPKDVKKCGATEEEIAFLVSTRAYRGWEGQRVELNAMTSDQFITWLEKKLIANDVQKVIPSAEGLGNAYARALIAKRIGELIEEVEDEIKDGVTIPKDKRPCRETT